MDEAKTQNSGKPSQGATPAVQPPRGTVTLVFTDLEKSSELSARFQEAFEALRDEHFRLLREALSETNGYEIETAGDALFAAFNLVRDAIAFAVAAQRKMLEHNWESLLPGVGTLRVRIGMHTGTPFIGEDRGRLTYRGPATNLASRVQSAGHGGQSLLSGATYALAAQNLPDEVTLRDCGTHRLKGVGSEHLWQICHPALPGEFGPLTTLNPQRHNIPSPTSPLVGRDKEIAAWHAELRKPETRVLTLWAFGGMGKTRAALQLAETCVEEDADLFPHGVWWVRLEDTRSGELMFETIAATLGLASDAHTPPQQKVMEFLRERQALLVLDNTEQIPDANVVINALLQAPGIKCLVTTRQGLNLLSEVRREVPPLSLADARWLFIEQMRHKGAAIEPSDPAITRLCQRLEGVPLALHLAASWPSLTPTAILTRLDRSFGLMRLKSQAADLPPRQQALQVAIEWSYSMINAEQQQLFVELSVFAGGFTLDDADAIAASGDAFEGVMELHRHSLLRAVTDPQTQEPRYFMLEALREYALEHLQKLPDGGRGARERHAAHFADVLDELSQQLRSASERQALERGAVQLDNARAALAFAARECQPELAARLALGLERLLWRFGLVREAAQTLQTGYSLAEAAPDLNVALRARLRFERASTFYDAFAWEETLRLGEAALALFEECGDVRGQADTWNLLGLLALRSNQDFELAHERFTRSQTLFAQSGYSIGVGLTHNNRGLTELEAKRRDTARPHFEKALEIYRAAEYQRGIAEALTNLGVIAEESADNDSAAQYYQQALEIELSLRHQIGVARALFNLGEIAIDRDQYQAALRYYTAAGSLFERSGSPFQGHATNRIQSLADRADSSALQSWRDSLKDQALDEVAKWATA